MAIIDIDGYRAYLEKKERSPNTIDTYVVSVKLFFSLFNEADEASVIQYKEYLKKSFKPKTVNIRIIGIKNYCEYIGSPIAVRGIKTQRPLSVENVITRDEIETLLSGLKADKNERGYWIIMFLSKTGARVSEFTRLKKNALAVGYEDMFTKGKVRRIYYPAKLIEDSRQYFEKVQGEYLFPSIANNHKTSAPITSRGVSALLKSWGKRYGIRAEAMHAHGFRHFFAKEFLRNGGDLTLLSDLLGHESVETTSVYTRHTGGEMADELSRIIMAETPSAAEIPAAGAFPQYLDIIALQQETIRAQREAIELAKIALQNNFKGENNGY
jgi:integrase